MEGPTCSAGPLGAWPGLLKKQNSTEATHDNAHTAHLQRRPVGHRLVGVKDVELGDAQRSVVVHPLLERARAGGRAGVKGGLRGRHARAGKVERQ